MTIGLQESRDADYADWRAAMLQWQKQCEQHVLLRDHFAAAALTGLLVHANDDIDEETLDTPSDIAYTAYQMADAMLRERDNHIADAVPVPEVNWQAAYDAVVCKARDIADDICGVGSGVTVQSDLAEHWLDAVAREYHRVRIELEQLRTKTNHDAVPEARASESPCAGHAGTGGTSVGVPATGAESGSTPDAQGFGRSCEYPCQPFDSAPTTDQERFVRFQSAVMNWISEATGFFHDDVLRTDDARDVITNACMRCWDAFDRIAYPTTNHDAVPEARASLPTADHAVCRGRESGCGTGKQPAPPCVETDGFSSGSRSGQINRSPERQSPDRECGESLLRDVPQPDNGRAAGGPEHHISEAEIDALEFVVEGGRIANIHDYGILRSLLVKLRPEWESDRPQPIKYDLSDRSNPVAPAVTVGGVDRPVSYAETDQNRIFYGTKRDTTQPRNGALSGGPDPDSRVWETPCTPPTHATQPQGSVQGEGSFRDSRNAKEPVAWAVMQRDGFGIEGTFTDRLDAADSCDNRQEIVPLYRHPSPALTDEEREAMECFAEEGWEGVRWSIVARHINTLRKLLERLGGGR